MRRSIVWGVSLGFVLAGCSGGGSSSGFGDDGAGNPSSPGADAGSSGNVGSLSDGGGPSVSFEAGGGNGGGGADSGGDATITVSTTIYAHTDDTLYSMDPQTKAVTQVGKFAGTSGASGDKSITDLAVNANGDVYVNSETVVYKAALPAQGGTVQLTKVASIVSTGQKFYALAFVPAGVLGANEALVGGDGSGELWTIDQSTGATKDLGNFGTDPNDAASVLGLSGDLVFYLDASNKPTGLATVRSCKKGTTTCVNTSDYLVGVDMNALKTAFTSGTPAASLLGGIYGGSSTMTGTGIGYGAVYGLGAWEGNVYGFTRGASGTNAKPPYLLQLDTSTGKGQIVSSSFSFTNGWSGAGVTTKVTIVVPPPPPPPPPPK